jgi:hypothetical protein
MIDLDNKIELFLDDLLSYIDIEGNIDSVEDMYIFRESIKNKVLKLLND